MPCSCAVQPAADSRAQSLHSAMTLRVQGPAAFRFCMLLPTLPSLHAHALPFNASARSHSSHADTGSFYWYCAQLLHQAAAARSARLAHACELVSQSQLQSSSSRGWVTRRAAEAAVALVSTTSASYCTGSCYRFTVTLAGHHLLLRAVASVYVCPSVSCPCLQLWW
jgi:hypothetical protein